LSRSGQTADPSKCVVNMERAVVKAMVVVVDEAGKVIRFSDIEIEASERENCTCPRYGCKIMPRPVHANIMS
jgi:hypothetical protein